MKKCEPLSYFYNKIFPKFKSNRKNGEMKDQKEGTENKSTCTSDRKQTSYKETDSKSISGFYTIKKNIQDSSLLKRSNSLGSYLDKFGSRKHFDDVESIPFFHPKLGMRRNAVCLQMIREDKALYKKLNMMVSDKMLNEYF